MTTAPPYFEQEVCIEVTMPVTQAMERGLDALWGYPAGVVPLDAEVADDHRLAAHALHRSAVRKVCLRVRVYKDGRREVVE